MLPRSAALPASVDRVLAELGTQWRKGGAPALVLLLALRGWEERTAMGELWEEYLGIFAGPAPERAFDAMPVMWADDDRALLRGSALALRLKNVGRRTAAEYAAQASYNAFLTSFLLGYTCTPRKDAKNVKNVFLTFFDVI